MKLRRYMLAGAAALGLIGTTAGPVTAQMAVVDVRAIAQAMQQVRQLQSQLAQLQQTYAAIAHLPQAELNRLAQQGAGVAPSSRGAPSPPRGCPR